MRRKIKFSFLILTLFISSCSIDIVPAELIDMSAPFLLKVPTKNPETLEVNSEKWKGLIEWGNNNKEGWTKSPASYIGNAYLTQGDLRLIHTKDSKGVVIGFVDKDGNPKQFMKKIEKGELSFLYE